MFCFLPLINNSVNIGLSFYYLAYQQSHHQNDQYFALFNRILFFNIFINIISVIWFSIKALESLYYSKPRPSHLLINNLHFAWYGSLWISWISRLYESRWQPITLNNAFVLSDPEFPILNILYSWSGIPAQSRLSFLYFLL